ncbi:MATE family efflux transporter, partial [Chloroflexota bacterium]
MRKPSFDRDWTSGSVFRNLLVLSWPVMVGQSLNMLGPTVDMIWVGKLGAVAVASVGISGMVMMVVNSLVMGLFTGVRAMVSRFFGAGDTDQANHIAQQALVMGLIFSAFTALIGIFFADQILEIFGVEPDVVARGGSYLRIQLAGMITMSLTIMAQTIMQASGDTVTPMKIAVIFRVFHIVLCPFLIFGWWIFPRMEVDGAAVTSVISQGLGGAIGLWVLFYGRTRIRLTMKKFSLDWNIIWRLVKIGIPSSISSAHRMFINLMLVWFISPFGTVAVAAHSLVQRVDTFVQTPCGALGQSAGVLAGQNLGAGQPDRAARTGWMAVGLFTGFMAFLAVGMWFWAENIVYIFSTDPALVDMTASFLRIQIAGYMMFGVAIILSLCVEGVGDTLFTMGVTLV